MGLCACVWPESEVKLALSHLIDQKWETRGKAFTVHVGLLVLCYEWTYVWFLSGKRSTIVLLCELDFCFVWSVVAPAIFSVMRWSARPSVPPSICPSVCPFIVQWQLVRVCFTGLTTPDKHMFHQYPFILFDYEFIYWWYTNIGKHGCKHSRNYSGLWYKCSLQTRISLLFDVKL